MAVFAQYLVMTFALGLGAAGLHAVAARPWTQIIFPAVALVALASTLSGGEGHLFYRCQRFGHFRRYALGGAAELAAAYRLVKALRRSFIAIALAVFIAMTFFPNTLGAPLAFYQETILPGGEYSESAPGLGIIQLVN